MSISREIFGHNRTNSNDKETNALKSGVNIESDRLVKAVKYVNGVLCTEHPNTSLCH